MRMLSLLLISAAMGDVGPVPPRATGRDVLRRLREPLPPPQVRPTTDYASLLLALEPT